MPELREGVRSSQKYLGASGELRHKSEDWKKILLEVGDGWCQQVHEDSIRDFLRDRIIEEERILWKISSEALRFDRFEI